MIYLRMALLSLFWVILPLQALATPDDVEMAVWANEAIINTYTYNHQNFMARQKEIAKFFTADGWINFSKALQDSKLPDAVKNNAYFVSAVATMPPELKRLKDNQWQVNMPILVVYQNPSYKQKQSLNIMMTFIEAPSGTGVRGLAITNMQSTVASPPCECSADEKTKAMA